MAEAGDDQEFSSAQRPGADTLFRGDGGWSTTLKVATLIGLHGEVKSEVHSVE